MKWIILILTTLPVAAAAHEAITGWTYPEGCCHDQDCIHLENDEVEIKNGNFYIPSMDLEIPIEDANSSPDGYYHVCGYQNTYDGRDYGIDFEQSPQGPKNPKWYLRQNFSLDEYPEEERYHDVSPKCFWAPGLM